MSETAINFRVFERHTNGFSQTGITKEGNQFRTSPVTAPAEGNFVSDKDLPNVLQQMGGGGRLLAIITTTAEKPKLTRLKGIKESYEQIGQALAAIPESDRPDVRLVVNATCVTNPSIIKDDPITLPAGQEVKFKPINISEEIKQLDSTTIPVFIGNPSIQADKQLSDLSPNNNPMAVILNQFDSLFRVPVLETAAVS